MGGTSHSDGSPRRANVQCPESSPPTQPSAQPAYNQGPVKVRCGGADTARVVRRDVVPMIRFPCHCRYTFEVADDMAGGLLQCPKCGRLNDVPTLSDLGGINPDDG